VDSPQQTFAPLSHSVVDDQLRKQDTFLEEKEREKMDYHPMMKYIYTLGKRLIIVIRELSST
jgi:hypothetical protein